MKVIDRIMTHPDIAAAPPVLIDIGASGELHKKWKAIAKYSICIAFDADSREMGFTEKETDTFKRLLVFNAVVTDRDEKEIDFYLTKSPFCSSSLEPENEKLKVWSFEELFLVEKKIRIKAMRLKDVLAEAQIERIDWFKTDTQGTDLRLFKALPEAIRKNVLVTELEPGILDGYQGEDKLFEVIRYMHEQGFFMSAMDVKGTQRISPAIVNGLTGFHRKVWQKTLMKSPGWAELSYLNTLKDGTFSRRTYLLAFLFAVLEKQYGFAIEVAASGRAATGDSIFDELKQDAVNEIRRNNLSWPRIMMKRAVNKLVSYL